MKIPSLSFLKKGDRLAAINFQILGGSYIACLSQHNTPAYGYTYCIEPDHYLEPDADVRKVNFDNGFLGGKEYIARSYNLNNTS